MTNPNLWPKHLEKILHLFHHMEKFHQMEQKPDQNDNWPAHDLQILQTTIEQCSQFDNPVAIKLAKHSKHLTDKMDLRHFTTIMVAFERALDRSLRDDEFLITEEDRAWQSNDKQISRPNSFLCSSVCDLVGELVLVLDSLRSAFNVGSIFRSAECAGAKKIYLTGYTPGPDSEKTKKTAMGADTYISWQYHSKIEDLFHELKTQGFRVVALETAQNSQNIFDYLTPPKTAFVVGNERFGLDRSVLALCDDVVTIPTFGQKNSLNVSNALTIAAYKWRENLRI